MEEVEMGVEAAEVEGAPQDVAADDYDSEDDAALSTLKAQTGAVGDDDGKEGPQSHASSSGSLTTPSGLSEAWKKVFVKAE